MTVHSICPICSTPNKENIGGCTACGTVLRLSDEMAHLHCLPAGTRLQGGQFTLLNLLGQGGFGITYRARDHALQRDIAIKEFFPQDCHRDGTLVEPSDSGGRDSYQKARERFLKEARILAKLDHPGIVQVYTFFEENNTAYMAQEYLKGESLQDLIDSQGPLPEAEVISYMDEVASALQEVHEAGLLHRDIKPGNVMVTTDGRVVLFDFGSAREFTPGSTMGMTSMVTPGYAPLEQYGRQARFGPYTDIYSLGATLYHLLTGCAPPPAADRALGVILHPPVEVKPDLSPYVNDVVLWAMEMKIAKRPQSVTDFIQVLHSAGTPVLRSLSPAGLSPALIPDEESSILVKVSGREFCWPAQCACCGRESTSSYTITHSQKLSSPQVRSWEMPYCSECLEHLQFYQKSLQVTAYRQSVRQWLGAFSAAAVTTFLIGGPIHSGWVGALEAALLFGVCLTFCGCQTLNERKARRQAAARGLLHAKCCTLAPAVECKRWFGSVHTFSFQSKEYAEAFRRANAGKLV